MLNLEAEWPSIIYVNCRHIVARTRPAASFSGLGREKYIFRVKYFCFCYVFEINFSEHNKICEAQKLWWELFPNSPLLPAGLVRTDARKSSIWGLLVCAGGLGILNIYFQFTTFTGFANFAT